MTGSDNKHKKTDKSLLIIIVRTARSVFTDMGLINNNNMTKDKNKMC